MALERHVGHGDGERGGVVRPEAQHESPRSGPRVRRRALGLDQARRELAVPGGGQQTLHELARLWASMKSTRSR